MKIVVDNQETLNVLVAVCSAAGVTRELNTMRMAVVVAENVSIKKESSEQEDKKEN